MADYVIVGAGASGLFTAWRLLTSGTLKPEDTVRLYEWADAHVGGRIHTYPFPGGTGQYIEAGGMRFATAVTDGEITGGHVLVQNLVRALKLEDLVVDFVESDSRLYYLRGQNIYEHEIPKTGSPLPYYFDLGFLNKGYNDMSADGIMAHASSLFAPGSENWTRAQWCDFFSNGTLQNDIGGVFQAGTKLSDIGYWNLLYAYLGDEGFSYVADANGYSSSVINWNSADAMQGNCEYGSNVKYKRLAGGYGGLFHALRDAVAARDPDCIRMKSRLLRYAYDEATAKFTCDFAAIGAAADFQVTADYLFLAMPRRALELIAARCDQNNALNQPAVLNYLQSAIDQPSVKVGMLFETAWWADPAIVQYTPHMTDGTGGPSITNLPLRQAYYFGNNAVDAKDGGPYVLLASYDDMVYESFWHELEIESRRTVAPSHDYQALNGPAVLPAGSTMERMVLSQLSSVHGLQKGKAIPPPLTTLFMDWGSDPFGGGYHAWSAHYDICDVMRKVRAPATELLGQPRNLFIVGSCYSFDQAWVEGALCTAESVLQDYLGLPAFCALPSGYCLIG
jgi:Flavin containing amine oxidoreductase